MLAKKEAHPPCALCKQPVEIAGFCLLTAEGEKYFCCDGCLYVYQLFNETNNPPPPDKNS
jgi:hypothetical protein